jgi:apolipoprotein N-acyltransferase
MSRLPAWVAAVLAVTSGLAVLAAFPPYGLWWLAAPGVALLALATAGQRARRGAWLGLLHGLVFFVPLLSWSGLYVGHFPWLLLASSQTVFTVLLGMLLPLVWRWPTLMPGLTGAVWTAVEYLRSAVPFGGFPWGRLAFSQSDAPTLGLAALGGAVLVTFAVALTGGLMAFAVRPLLTGLRKPFPSRLRILRPALALVLAGGVVFAGQLVPLRAPGGREVTVAVVQGNVPRLGLDFNAQRRAVLDNHVQATVDLARQVEAGQIRRPELVIWPENSSDVDPLTQPDAAAAIDRAARAVNAPILVGAVLHGPGRFLTNAGMVWSPETGPGQRYVKRHPVPFAEYVPFRPLARRISTKVDLVPRDFHGGTLPGVLQVGPARIGDVICFEVAYDGLVRDTVTGGAQLLVVQTNNATFGRSAESAQQLAMVRLRAVEHGRSAMMASTSGVSAVVAYDGAVIAESALFSRTVLLERVRLGESSTFATRIGPAPEYVFCLTALLGLLSSAVSGFRRRRISRVEKVSDRGDPAVEGNDG